MQKWFEGLRPLIGPGTGLAARATLAAWKRRTSC
jgi:hypothetical protein